MLQDSARIVDAFRFDDLAQPVHMLECMTTKKCSRCEQTKPTSEFRPNKAAKDNLHYWCRPCARAYDRERQQAKRVYDKPGRPKRTIIDGKTRCGRCGETKPVEDFGKDSRNIIGLQSSCKACQKAMYNAKKSDPEFVDRRRVNARRWNAENPERHAANKQRWNEANPDAVKLHRDRSREKFLQNTSKKLSVRLRVRLSDALRRQIRGMEDRGRGASAVRDLGCTLHELMDHLEAKFQPGMSWDNYGQWHIDHIVPLVSYDLTDPEQCKRACHFSNLQPMWASENIRKGAKVE